MHHSSKLAPVTIIDISYTRISFRTRITHMLLASCNACRIWLRKQFFTYWKDNNVLNIEKQNQQTDKYDWLRWLPSLSLESPFVVTSIQYVCYLYEEDKSGSSVNKSLYRMFTVKNLSGHCLPTSLDALVLRHGVKMGSGPQGETKTPGPKTSGLGLLSKFKSETPGLSSKFYVYI